jgi:2-polyprenyl-6-methoxyphenol hydroxylase-like FAD-dependent oxidoreductase
MNTVATRDTDVLIVGAGPTGLVLALWLTRIGVLRQKHQVLFRTVNQLINRFR